eukprot:CAMPEP_0185591368 /NCGR_PEP_ID=MMETSP0434-20130131/64236_1 /TAXON_ID=626734 ORGANISM="Favella taraikaensis, Strain Fe Narragansett Bay" /NCGR_SAMPLE_ID=MMETSP0434 /ASSEMBLY_ACC=CAM_ASM_000379 /LENGTH=34 /DNA_ID= /DNA_START= /DNA_END= /DNA_ORIENTATION=
MPPATRDMSGSEHTSQNHHQMNDHLNATSRERKK